MTKILIDEAVVRDTLEVLEKYSGVDQRACDVEEAINQALANEALDKMAENARELGLSYEQPAQPLTDEQNRELFAAFVKKNLGDIAVMDGGRYISPKINNYWLVWQEAHGITKGN